MTRKIVSEMTYNVSSGTLNPTIPYHTIPRGPGHAPFGGIIFCRLLAVTHLRRLDMASFIHSKDMEEVPYRPITSKIGIAHAQYDVIKMLG